MRTCSRRWIGRWRKASRIPIDSASAAGATAASSPTRSSRATSRFKAATSGAGSANALAGYGTDQYVKEYEAELGTPWKNPKAYLAVSYPLLHADRIVTPTLFLCGDQDWNVPLINSEQMYQALKSLGRETQLIVYPGASHSLEKPSHRRDRMERYLAWYGKYLEGGEERTTR